MDLSTPAETPHVDSLRALSVAEIDREVRVLTDALDHANNIEAATRFEERRQTLLSARRLAVVRERIRERQGQAAVARDARARFDALEAALRPELQTRASAIDATVVALVAQVADFHTAVTRVNELHELLMPPQPGRELALLGPFERLARIEQPLEESLARAGVLPNVTVSVFAAASVEAHVVRAAKFAFDEARHRLPPAPDGTAEESGI